MNKIFPNHPVVGGPRIEETVPRVPSSRCSLPLPIVVIIITISIIANIIINIIMIITIVIVSAAPLTRFVAP